MAKRINKDTISTPDPFEYIISGAKESRSEIEKLNKVAEEFIATIKSQKELKTDARGIIEQTKAQNELNRAYKTKIEYDKVSRLSKKQMESAEQSLQKQRERSIALMEKEAKKAAESARPYKQLEKSLNDAKRKYQDLAASGLAESKVGKAQLKVVTDLRMKYEGLNKAIGNNQFAVGRYKDALGPLSQGIKGVVGLLGQLGFAFGGVALATKAIQTLRDFDEGAADVAKTLGVTKDEARGISEELLKIDTRSSVAELQKIAAIGGQLGITKGEIIAFTEATDKLNVALGDEFSGGAEEITSTIGGLRNIFADIKSDNVDKDLLNIGNALNVLGAEGSATAPVVSDFANRIGGVGIPLGLTSDQVLGLSATLQELNVNAERGGTATTKVLQKITTNTKDFAKLAGMPLKEFEELVNKDIYGAFTKVVEGSKKFGYNAVELGKLLDKLGLDGAGTSEVFLKLGANTDLLEKRVTSAGKALKSTDSITEEFNTKNNTLSANIEKISKAWDSYVIGADSATGASGKASAALGFIAKNLPEIINALLYLIKVFVLFKATMASLKLVDQVKNFKALGNSAEGAAEDMNKAQLSAKDFGKALKGMGIAIAIELFIEMALAIYDYASGAQAARFQQDQLNAAIDIGSEAVGKYLEKLAAVSAARDLENRELLSQGKITQAEYNRRVKADNYLTRVEIQNTIDRLKAKRLESVNTYKESKEILKNRSLTEAVGFGTENALEYAKKETNVARNLAEIKIIDTELKGLYDKYGQLGVASKEFDIQLNNETKATFGSTKATKEKAKSLKDANDQIERAIELLKEEQELTDDNAVSNAEANTEYNLASQLLIVSETGEYQITLLDELIKKEYDLKRAIIERVFAEETDGVDAGSQEYQNAELKRQQKIGELENEFSTKRKDALKELNDAQEDYADKQSEILQAEWDKNKEIEEKAIEEEKKRLEDRAKFRNDLIERGTKFLADQIDKQIAIEDKKADAAKNTQQYLEELAKAGSIEAKDSIIEQQRLEEEAERRKIELERRKANILAVGTVLQTYNNKIADGDKNPVQATASDVEAVFALLGALPKFFEGTENTGKSGLFSDQFGAVTGVTHADERVVNAKDNKMIGDMSNRDLAQLAYMHNTGKLIEKGRDVAGSSFDIPLMLSKYDEIISAIQSLPEKEIDAEKIGKTLHKITTVQKTPNFKTINEFIVKS